MKFSVIIPVYNKANTIIQALDSINNQTYQDFEIIVVNDGSTDSVLDVLESYSHPIRVVSQENGGVSVARNAGIDMAKGEYVCFLDADDEWYPDHLEVITQMMTSFPNVYFFGTCHKTSFPDGRIIEGNVRISQLGDTIYVEDLIGFVNKYGGLINTNSICVKREILFDDNIRFEEGEKLGEDVDVWYRIALKHPIVISKKMTTHYRREYSTATIITSNPPDWCFVRRSESILSREDISPSIKKSYITMCDRYYLSISRELNFFNKKNDAWGRLKLVHNKFSGRFLLTFILVCLPSPILNALPRKLKR